MDVNTKAIVEAIEQQDEAAARDEWQHLKDRLGLDEKDREAKRRLDYLAGRATEFSAILKKTEIPEREWAILVEKHPGLQVFYDANETNRDDVRAQTFGEQSRLTRGRAAFAELGPEDVTPRPEKHECWIPAGKFGQVCSTVWRVYQTLGNVRPLADVDAAVRRLEESFAELQARLASIAGHHDAPTE